MEAIALAEKKDDGEAKGFMRGMGRVRVGKKGAPTRCELIPLEGEEAAGKRLANADAMDARRKKFYSDFEKAHDEGFLEAQAEQQDEKRERLARQADPLGLTLRGKERKRFKAEQPRPAHDRQFELGTRDIVAPYAVGGTRRAETVTVNVRETPLNHMYARRKITDAEWRAGDMFRRLCEAVELGGGVIDPARIKVDTSGAGDPLTVRAMEAAKQLAGAVERIGHTDYLLLYDVCTVGRSLLQVAKRWYAGLDGSPRLAKEAGKHIGQRVRDALAQLADLWGLEAKAGGAKTRTLGTFGRVPLDPEHWNYSQDKAKAEHQARRKRRRRKR